ncbi:MAG: N-acetylneuraminate synthase [Candidatus Aenigmatarchaeota archaeon]|nr:MAG: N-acetylneuraminate synthase [Candidatus Aenigmarchaeota archaeon]
MYYIADIGINHNGDIVTAFKMIKRAAEIGIDCVKFQKRNIDCTYTQEELAKSVESPFGNTYGDLKRGLEFDYNAYVKIAKYCDALEIDWSASVWDIDSVDFLMQFDVPFIKIPSAMATNIELLKYVSTFDKPVILSTGGCNMWDVRAAIEILTIESLTIMQCTSIYPSPNDRIDLDVIDTYGYTFGSYRRYGYSGHEEGWYPSVLAAVKGVTVIERHVTLDKEMWGTDQSSSLEFEEYIHMMGDIDVAKEICGRDVKYEYHEEREKLAKYRRP